MRRNSKGFGWCSAETLRSIFLLLLCAACLADDFDITPVPALTGSIRVLASANCDDDSDDPHHGILGHIIHITGLQATASLTPQFVILSSLLPTQPAPTTPFDRTVALDRGPPSSL